MADASLNVKLTANTTELKSGLAEATKAAEQFSAKGKQLVQAGASMGNGLKQVGTAAQGLKGKLGSFASEMSYLTDELAAGINPINIVSSRLPALVRTVAGFTPVGRLAGLAVGVLGGNLLTMASQALFAGEKFKTFEEKVKEAEGSVKSFKNAAKEMEAALNDPKLANTTFGQMIVQIKELQLELANKAMLSDVKAQATGVLELGNELAAYITKFTTFTGNLNTAFGAVDSNVLRGVRGVTAFRGAVSIAAGPNKVFAESVFNMASGLKALGVPGNQAVTIANKYAKAIEAAGNDTLKMSQAQLQLAKDIKAAGDATGAANPELYKMADNLLRAAEAGVAAAQGAQTAAKSFLGMGSAAAQAARQVIDLVSALAQVGNVSGTMDNLWNSFGGAAANTATKWVGEFNKNLQYTSTLVKKAEGIRDGLDPMRQFNREQAELNEMQKLGIISTKEYNDQIAKMKQTIDGIAGAGGKGGGGGSLNKAADGVKRLGKEMQQAAAKPMADFQKGLESIATSAAQGVFDALMSIADGTKSAKEAFTEMAKSMLKQIAQLIFEMTVLKALQTAIGGLFGGGGGAVAGALGAKSLAAPMSVPRSTTIGNYAGFAPTPSVMQTMRSNIASTPSAAQPAPMKVEVNNYAGAQVKTRQDSDKIIIDIAIDAVADQITRGGGKIDHAMQRAFGARRVGY